MTNILNASGDELTVQGEDSYIESILHLPTGMWLLTGGGIFNIRLKSGGCCTASLWTSYWNEKRKLEQRIIDKIKAYRNEGNK